MQKFLMAKPEGETELGRPTLERREDFFIHIIYIGRERTSFLWFRICFQRRTLVKAGFNLSVACNTRSFGSGFGPATDTCESRI